jgi:DNA-binding NarL/FixJ family response regulator
MMEDTAQIAIVDDHSLFLQGLSRLLEEFPQPNTVRAYKSGLDLLNDLDAGVHFDLIIADLAMRPVNGIALIAALTERNMRAPVIIISGAEDATTKSNAARVGAFDFLHKSSSQDQLFQAIQSALESGPLTKDMLRRRSGRMSVDHDRGEHILIPKLAPQQVRVLRFLADGMTNKEIGQVMSISENTVKSHVKSIFRELSVTSRTAAVRQGQELGLF